MYIGAKNYHFKILDTLDSNSNPQIVISEISYSDIEDEWNYVYLCYKGDKTYGFRAWVYVTKLD